MVCVVSSHCDHLQVQSRAAYLLFYRRRAQAQQDPADLVPQLLEQRQQHLAAKEAAAQQAAEQEAAAAHYAAARAAAGCGGPVAAAAAGPSAMDADGPDVMVVDTDATAAAEGTGPGLVISSLDTTQEGWGSPALGTPAGAAAAAGGGIGGALLGMNSPAPAPPAQAGRFRTGPSRRMGAVDDSSDTSTSLRNTGLEEGDSSDGSSSRPRLRPGGQQRQREAAEAQAAADAVDSWGPLQGGPQRPARPSDQDADADMADRDV